ncbi:hypothetical protein [Plantactinospora alkalitolerans]|uniref:hypothetical protein n=1 Tax=Plantactinospora alkalitolerans TaxID=2789879 RepID=UPI002B1F6F26|nr:hypothetical protein [Plantactinospora alkalitolerans]
MLPSHDYYSFGVARIGEEIHIVAPLCDGERIVGVEAYDNDALGRESSPDPASTRFTYWKVEQPVDASVAEGRIVLGDDSAYQVTTVPAGSNIGLPELVGVTLHVDSGGDHVVEDVFAVAEVPAYPATANPEDVEYVYQAGSNEERLMTPGKIRQQSKCAADYPA